MVMPKSYDDLVDKLGREKEARGNVSSTKLTESECTKEVADITGNAFKQPLFAPGAVIKTADALIEISADITGGTTSAILQPKKKRGRPLGSKNRPKVKP